MKIWKGKWLIAVAAVHTVFAAIVFRQPLADIAGRGVYDTVGEVPMTAAVIWFVLFGFVLFIAGLAIDHLERASTQAVPRSLGTSLLGLSLAGIVLMPESRFWLLPPSIAMALGKKELASCREACHDGR